MRNGHRRTESENCCTISSVQKLRFKLYLNQNKSEISAFLKKSNRKDLVKTICVEPLDIPRAKSHQDLAFYFGRKDIVSPTGVSTQHDEDILSPILQKRRIGKNSLKKVISSGQRKVQQRNRTPKPKMDSKHKFHSSLYLSKASKSQISKQSSRADNKNKTKKGNVDQKPTKSKLVKSRLRKA